MSIPSCVDGNEASLSNLVIVFMYASLMLISIVLLIPIVLKRDKGRLDYVYIAMCAFIILWQLIEIVFYSVSNPDIILYLNGVRFVPMACIPVTFLLLVAIYYNQTANISTFLKYFFVITAVVISLLALAGPLRGFFWEEVLVSSLSPLILLDEIPNFGYYLAVVLVQLPVLGFAYIVITQRRKLPKQYRSSTTILLSCLILYTLAIVLFSLGIFNDMGLNVILVAVTMVNFFIYLAIIGKERGDYLNVWLGDVFNVLEDGVLIINERDMVVDANEAAKKILKSIAIDPDGLKVAQLGEQINKSGISFIRQMDSDQSTEKKRDLYITAGEFPVIYEINEVNIVHNGGSIGKYLVLSDVTRNRLYIERLQDLVGVDSLTGLLNRYSYEKILHEWDSSESLPLTLILGDVNDLKKVNDGWGHKTGDELLMQAAKALQTHCPEEGKVARIGGDEFIMVLKHHDHNDAAQVIENISSHIAQISNLSYPLSMALGSATKYSHDENMNALYAEADARMYENKKRRGETV